MMYRLYNMQASGNCYKIRLLLSQLNIPCQLVEVDIVKGESRTPDFLAKNLNGRVPVLQLDDDTFLPESNAALWYLAEGTDFMPENKLEKARVLQWMFFEQYSHEPYIATSRYWLHILKDPATYQAQLEAKRPGGLAALNVMNEHLESRTFFVNEQYSIADICLYAYTHVADEGNFSLEPFPHIRNWLQRVQQMPGYIKISGTNS